MNIKVGDIYKHYKGKDYKILAIARNSENIDEMLIIYQALYDCPRFGLNQIWARPLSNFTQTIFLEGKEISRFKKMD